MRTRRPTPSVQDDDAEGEEDIEDGGEDGADTEDKTLYCFCQKLSYGEVRICFQIIMRLILPITDDWLRQ